MEEPGGSASNVAGAEAIEEFHLKSESFKNWFLSQPGAYLNPDIAIVDYRAKNAGRGVQAVRDIPADAILFSIPRNSILSVETSSLVEAIPSIFALPTNTNGHVLGSTSNGSEGGDEADINGRESAQQQVSVDRKSWTALILVLIYEFFRKDPASPWKPYLDILPANFDTLMFWTDAEIAQLQGSSVIGRIGKQSAETEFRVKLIPIIRQHSHVVLADSKRDWSDEDLIALAHRMGSLIMAYAFDVDVDDVEEEAEASGEDGYVTDSGDEEEAESTLKAMVPMADMLNADAPPNASLFHDTAVLTMRSLRHIAAGEEILNDYGQLPRAELARRYGYVTDNYASFDCCEMNMDAVIDAVSTMRNEGVGIDLEPDDRARRLDYLDEKYPEDEDSFEIVWPDRSQYKNYFPLALVRVVCTLLATREEYKTAAKQADLDSLNRKDVKDVLRCLLRKRLATYMGNIVGDTQILNDPDLRSRHRTAVEVRLGERKLLSEALKDLNDEEEQPPNKKRRLGEGR